MNHQIEVVHEERGIEMDKKIKCAESGRKGQEYLKRIDIYKEAAFNVIKDSSDFDKNIILSNDLYIDKLQKADQVEYDILKVNMERADSREEREEIRKRMAEMAHERYVKDSENKNFYSNQQEQHREHNLKILGSIAVVAGVVYTFRKPIIETGKKYLLKI